MQTNKVVAALCAQKKCCFCRSSSDIFPVELPFAWFDSTNTHWTFKAALLWKLPSFGWLCMSVLVLCQSVIWSPELLHCSLLSVQEQCGVRWDDRMWKNESFNSIAGIWVTWGPPTWMGFFWPVIIDDKVASNGGEMRQNDNQCRHTGMKHDQTAELNRGIILPKILERWRQKELHYFHILLPTQLTMLLCLSHWAKAVNAD